MKLIDLFRRKKQQPISTQSGGGTSNSIMKQTSGVASLRPKRVDTPERKMTVEQLKSAVQQQKDKILELKNATSEYRSKIKGVGDASGQIDGQEKTLTQQEKEQTGFLADPRVSSKSKQDIKQNLKKIRSWLLDIKKAKAANKKSLKQLNDAIHRNERAIKINEQAVKENERALKIITESKEGEKFELKEKGIEEMIKGMKPEDLQPDEQVDQPILQEQRPAIPRQITVSPMEVSGFGKMKEGDYWEKGKIAK